MQFRKFITQAEGFDGVGREKLNPFVSAVVFMVIYFDKVNSFFFGGMLNIYYSHTEMILYRLGIVMGRHQDKQSPKAEVNLNATVSTHR
jgi:hypothetical protein